MSEYRPALGTAEGSPLRVGACLARDKMQMAGILRAIDIFFRRLAAQAAASYYLSLSAEIHRDSLIKRIERS